MKSTSIVLLLSLIFSTSLFAETGGTSTHGSPAVSERETHGSGQINEPAQPSSPQPLSQDELTQMQPASDSLMSNAQVQQMPVGASVDGTVVLSVLVALLIFVVLVAIL